MVNRRGFTLSHRGWMVCAVFLLGLASPAKSAETEWEYQLDAYYCAFDFTVHLTTTAIPYYANAREWDIYKRLLTHPMPRFLIFEASVNPLPLAGVHLKKQSRSLYDKGDIGEQNIFQSATAGFEEPAALSLFLGNVIDFKPVKKRKYAEGKGYIGYLLSVGNEHIKDNELIQDKWIEGEWKVKGDRKRDETKLQWSFRAGAKLHANSDIADVFYIGLRRSRVDYGVRRFSFFYNSGVMYKFDFDVKTFSPIQHQLVLDKKFPMPSFKAVPTLAFGFLYRTQDKYTGRLRDSTDDFQILLQPNLEF